MAILPLIFLLFINIKHIKKFTMSFFSSLMVELKNGYIDYVSRRNIKSVKEISKSLNFQSQSFFGRYFKRITGMSPREYINKYSIKAY